MENNLGLLVHLINFFLQIAAVVLALRLIRPSGKARAWVILSCSFILTVLHRLLDVLIHVEKGERILEWNDVIVTFSLLLLVAGIYLIREIFVERTQAQQKLEDRLDELLRFQKLTVGRELRMQELVKENTALRQQIAAAQPGETKS
ncbi:MAG: hypothetical protein Q8O58_11890 [Gallionella sp.]|nr:hypothetical protein [Gallionella sp.]